MMLQLIIFLLGPNLLLVGSKDAIRQVNITRTKSEMHCCYNLYHRLGCLYVVIKTHFKSVVNIACSTAPLHCFFLCHILYSYLLRT